MPAVIGHSLALPSRAASRETWDRWIAVGFALGSACFFIGPFPGFVQLVGAGADGVVFFAGSLLLHARRGPRAARGHPRARVVAGATTRPGGARRSSSPAPCCSTSARSTRCRTACPRSRRTGWSGPPTCSARPASWSPARSPTASRTGRGRPRMAMAAVNLAGCVLFGVAAIASYVVPVDRLDPRPRRRELEHLARRPLLPHRRAVLLLPTRSRRPRRRSTDDRRALRASSRRWPRSTATGSCSSRRPTTSCPSTACAPRRHAADRRGARARRDPDAQPGDLRDDLDGARGRSG